MAGWKKSREVCYIRHILREKHFLNYCDLVGFEGRIRLQNDKYIFERRLAWAGKSFTGSDKFEKLENPIGDPIGASKLRWIIQPRFAIQNKTCFLLSVSRPVERILVFFPKEFKKVTPKNNRQIRDEFYYFCSKFALLGFNNFNLLVGRASLRVGGSKL